MSKNNLEYFLLLFECQTDNAIGIKEFPDQDEVIWLPKSQIEYPDTEIDSAEKGEEIELEIPEWLAENKGLL